MERTIRKRIQSRRLCNHSSRRPRSRVWTEYVDTPCVCLWLDGWMCHSRCCHTHTRSDAFKQFQRPRTKGTQRPRDPFVFIASVRSQFQKHQNLFFVFFVKRGFDCSICSPNEGTRVQSKSFVFSYKTKILIFRFARNVKYEPRTLEVSPSLCVSVNGYPGSYENHYRRCRHGPRSPGTFCSSNRQLVF